MKTAKFAYIGCLTSEKRNGHGKGISVFSIDEANEAWQLVQVHATLENPGFLAIDSSQRYLYAGHGSTDGNSQRYLQATHSSTAHVSAHAIDPHSGRLRFLNSQPTLGNNALHLTVDPANRYVLVANGPGLAVFPVNKDGSLAPASDVVIPQPKAKPHQVFFDVTGRYVLAPGKGVDRIFVYRFDGANGKLVANDPPHIEVRDSHAPRHAVMHPTEPYLYVIVANEMCSAVGAYHWDGDKGELRPFQIVPSTPSAYTGENEGAEIAIAPSGRFLYVSNRGHDSIATLAVDADTGMLTPMAWDATLGKKPRFFALENGRIYVANQNSDTIAVFDADAQSGKLTPTSRLIETGTPTCIVFSRESAQ